MADNVNDSLKNLNQNIKDADANLAKLSKDFNVVFTEAVNRAARDAKVSIDQMFDAIAGRVGASKASKLKLLFDIVDEHGKTATPQTIQQKIDRIVNATPNARGTKLHIGMDWVDVDTANANLRRYKEQLKLIQDMPAAYDLVNRAVNAIIGEFDKEAAAKQKIIEKNEKILEQEIAIEEKQRSKAAAQQQKQEEKQYKEEQKWYDAKAKADRENERRAGEAKYRQMSKEIAEYGKALQRQIELETKANQIRRDYNKIKSDLQGVSRQSEEYKKGQQVLQQYRQELHNVYQEQKKIDNEYKGTRSAVYNQQRINGLRQEYEQLRRNGRQIKENKSSLESMLPTLRRLASAFGVAFSVQGLVQFGKKLVETRGEFELQQVALRSILQNKQLADEIWDKTMQAALQSPFTAMQLTKYTKQLAAYRIETDKLFDTTKRLADVSAGLGVDMQRLILAYGQVKAANYLRASEIRQFTEAGVNILGELSAYLTEVKGQAITTAQVMDMVQKRMIRFEDVEEIFKRLTNEGGIFYNMQYVQSQTVKGQINKLHDAYDQMLNSIGKSNEGVLKGTVSLMLNIVQNWREWKTVLDAIAFPAITVALVRFGKGLFAANAATIATDKSFKFLTRSGAKLNVQLKALSATLKAHPLFLIASIVVTAGAALINHAKAVNAVNKEYDELNGRLLETQHKMSSYEDKIKENNATIKDSSKSQKEHNEAQKDNARMLGELKRDYPDVANGMSIANNGIISMTNSMKEYNAQLRLQIQLNERAKASFFNQSLKKDAQQFDESINKQQSNLAEYTTKAERAYKKIENFLASGKKGILSDKELRDAMQKLQKMAAATSVEEYEKAYVEYATTKVNAGRQGLVSLSKALGSGFGFKSISGDRKLQSNREEIKDEIKDDYIYFGRYLREIALLSEDWNGQFALSTEEFISKNKDLLQNMLYTVKKDGTKEIGELGFAISEAFMDAASVSMTEQGQQEIIDELINQFKEKYGLDVEFGVRTKQTQREPDAGAEDKVLTLWRNRIKLIEEMNKKYKDLSKSVYGYAKSEQKVRGEYGLAWLAAGMPFDMNEIDFTTDEGVAEALAKFRKLIPQKLFAELEKEISGRKATIELDAQVRIREDFGRQMEEAFGNYELTLELQKVNLPKRELEEIFGFDLTSTDDIRKAVDKFYNKQIALGADPTGLIKQVEGYYKKLDDMDRKSLLDRLKMYTEYLTEGRDKAVQIHLDELNKMADLDELYAKGYYTKTQYDNISDKIRKETSEKLSKNEWQQFKESDYYVTMFEDLGNVATTSIDLMLKQLKNLKKRLKDLDPTQVKEIVKAIENLEKTRRARSPFKTFFDDLKTLRKWRKTGYRQSELDYLIPKAEEQERTLKGLEEIAAQYEKEYDDIVHGKKEGNESLIKVQWDDATEAVNKAKEELKQTKDVIDEINTANNDGYAAWIRTFQGLARGAQYFSDMANAAGTIATEMMDMFDGVDNASKQLAHDIADIASNTAALGGDIAKAIASEGTDVGSMIDGLVRTWNIIKGASSASEVNINRIVERETIRLEGLERSLERVKRARDKAWDTVTVVQNEKEVEQAINDQIAAYDALIAAEQSRKNPNDDTLRQWKNEREQLYEQLEEEREEFLKKFGGIGESDYLSAAEGFVDAWKSAFLETGDGLQGLEDHFDEFIQDWFTKQATMRVAGNMLEPLFRQIDAAVDRYGTGGTDAMLSEIERVRDMAAAIFPDLSLALEDLAGMFGVGGEGSLSGLAAGIQGMTEEQANILEAYWNSVRMYTASIDMNVSRIAEMLGVGGPSSNPMLAQLQTIATNTGYIPQIYTLLTGTRRNLGNGQGFITYNQ